MIVVWRRGTRVLTPDGPGEVRLPEQTMTYDRRGRSRGLAYTHYIVKLDTGRARSYPKARLLIIRGENPEDGA